MPYPSNITAWPPTYQLRRSKRARRVNFKISVKHGLEVTVPQRFNEAELPAILDSKKRWILKHLNAVQLQREQQPEEEALPTQLVLPAINETWPIEHYDSFGKPRLIIRPHHQLVLMGDLQQTEQCQQLLIGWLKGKAQRHFQTWLSELSQRTELTFNKLSIRGQQTRWGSCSSEKNISLNYKLLFLPPELTEHVLLHELCHTRYMSHGVRFWGLLTKHDPACEAHDAALSKVQSFMPMWVD